MANPISTGRRAVLGLSKMKKAPTGNLPTLREPQPTVIERTLDKPVDRRTFLEGAKNAAAAASNIDKLGALGDLIPEVVEPTLSNRYRIDGKDEIPVDSFNKIKSVLTGLDSISHSFDEINNSIANNDWKEFKGIAEKLGLTDEEALVAAHILRGFGNSGSADDVAYDYNLFRENDKSNLTEIKKYLENNSEAIMSYNFSPQGDVDDHYHDYDYDD